jgi:adenylylsulfate kinase
VSLNAISLPGCTDAAKADGAKLRSPVCGSAWSVPETGLTVWFTGPSGAHNATLAGALAKLLRKADLPTVLLDENVMRQGFCSGLGLSRADRAEHVRRITELAHRLSESGAVVLVAAIAPYRDSRLAARRLIGQFIEVYVNAPNAGEPYEAPVSPELECRTESEDITGCTAVLLATVMRMRAMRAQYVAAGVAG